MLLYSISYIKTKKVNVRFLQKRFCFVCNDFMIQYVRYFTEPVTEPTISSKYKELSLYLISVFRFLSCSGVTVHFTNKY